MSMRRPRARRKRRRSRVAFGAAGRVTFRRDGQFQSQGGFPMAILVLGLIIFLGLHSTRIVSESGRERAIARLGEGPWKGIYSLLSAIGFVLIVWGFAEARATAPSLWTPLPGARHATILLMLISMVLLAALSLQAKPYHRRDPSPDGLERRRVRRGSSHRQRLGGRRRAVRRVPGLGGRRPREFICPRPPQRRRLSGAELGRDDRRDCRRARALGRLAFWLHLAVRRFAAWG